jgi:hypothetical protein
MRVEVHGQLTLLEVLDEVFCRLRQAREDEVAPVHLVRINCRFARPNHAAGLAGQHVERRRCGLLSTLRQRE